MAKYKRFHTILREKGYEGRPVEFLTELLKNYKNVYEAADAIGTTHATLYSQLAAHNLIVEKQHLVVRGKDE